MNIKRGYPVRYWPVDYWPDLPYVAGAVVDGVATADTLARLMAAWRSTADGATLAETIARLMAATGAAGDEVVTGDALLAGLSVATSITDGYIIGQLPDGAGVFLVAIADGVEMSESLAWLIEALGLVSILFTLRQPDAAFRLRLPTITITREV